MQKIIVYNFKGFIEGLITKHEMDRILSNKFSKMAKTVFALFQAT